MKRKQYGVILVLAILAGLFGGVISNKVFKRDSVFAKEQSEPSALIVAKEFRVVADDGRTLATLGGRPGMEPFMPVSPALHFYDREGQLRILIGLMPGDMPHIDMLDENRNLIWVAPPKSKQ